MIAPFVISNVRFTIWSVTLRGSAQHWSEFDQNFTQAAGRGMLHRDSILWIMISLRLEAVLFMNPQQP